MAPDNNSHGRIRDLLVDFLPNAFNMTVLAGDWLPISPSMARGWGYVFLDPFDE